MYIKRIVIAVAFLGLIILAFFSYKVYNLIFVPNTAFEEEQVAVYIETDSNYLQVREQLEPLVNSLNDFDIVAEKKGYTKNVKPGKYFLRKGMNNDEMVNVLRSQNSPVWVTFNNQERLEDLAGRVAGQIEADSISLLKAMKDSTFLSTNDIDIQDALGMYIPNKYELFWNTDAEEFRDRMYKEYRRFWTDERMDRANKIGLTPQEVTVLASIVQKETAMVDERPKVAGVYMNRLNNGWKLDADPTVIYAIKERSQNFDTIIKRVLYKDLEIDSPYNTYRNGGLPPGPIYMPDISSIDAVLNYEDHDYYFFVANVEDLGYHKFAKTLSQHNRNKQEYVRWINKMGIKR